MSVTNLYSFNQIIAASWDELADKLFVQVDTNEELGFVYGKYDNMASLAAICTNGRIEFLNSDKSYIKQVFGENLDVNMPLFKIVN